MVLFLLTPLQVPRMHLTLKAAWAGKVINIQGTKFINCADCLLQTVSDKNWWYQTETSDSCFLVCAELIKWSCDPIVGWWWFADSIPLVSELEHWGGESVYIAHILGIDGSVPIHVHISLTSVNRSPWYLSILPLRSWKTAVKVSFASDCRFFVRDLKYDKQELVMTKKISRTDC